MVVSIKRGAFALLIALLALAGALLAGPAAAAASAKPTEKSGAHHGHPTRHVKAGAASRSVLPLVNGSRKYLRAGFPPDDDAISPGIFVPEWDDGRIAVGNGEDEAHWVRDDLRVRALALSRPSSKRVTVLLSADLYMIFRVDAESIRDKVDDRLPRRDVNVLVGSTHNHHGPDTAFDVNHDWYEHMTDQAADAVVRAVKRLRPARLRVGSGEHWFGMDDGDPQVIDPSMNVLQAVGVNRRIIGTVVQWNNHPETTLGWSPPVDLAEDCAILGWEGEQCDAEGRYFTSDYAGELSRTIEHRVGGEALYFVGALGHLVGPGGANVWEVDRDHPLGNQFDPPPGAAVPGGAGFTYTDRNFRRAIVIGEQAAKEALDIIRDGERIDRPKIEFDRQTFYSRLSNIGFRVLLVVDPQTGYTQLGHVPPTAYTCPVAGPKTDETCESEGLEDEEDPLVGTIRSGDHLKSEVGYLRIGPVGMMFLPGEVAGELVIGLPAEFRSDPARWYEEPLDLNAFGDDYTTPGYLLNRMHDRYEFTIGLGNDELGYIFPISNWRVKCVADDLAGPGTCQALHDAGVIEHPDAVAGTTCKAITEHPEQLDQYPPDAAQAVSASCRYGQALGEAQNHYEETNSAGWDLAEDMLGAVAELTGDDDPTEVNPDFPGYWEGYPPPG
ncbi:MAG: phage T7 gene 1.2 family protein [Solirubrobacterales bacterium]